MNPDFNGANSQDFNAVVQALSTIQRHPHPQTYTTDPSNDVASIIAQNKITSEKAIKSAARDGHEFDGLCQKFVEENVYGKSGIYPSAIDAWQDQAAKGNVKPGTEGAKDGDVIVFKADNTNGGFGHTGIVTNGGKDFTSATYDGVKTVPIDQWQKATGQEALGYYNPATPQPQPQSQPQTP